MCHIETCRHPRPARLRAVGAAAPGECLAMVRDVSPTASPLLRHVSTQVSRDGQPALCRRPRAAAIRRPSPRNSSPHLHRRGRRLPLACSPQPAPRAVRCAPRGDVRRIPMSFPASLGQDSRPGGARPSTQTQYADDRGSTQRGDLLRQSLTPREQVQPPGIPAAAEVSCQGRSGHPEHEPAPAAVRGHRQSPRKPASALIV
jgi:hypothetical protein